MRIPRPRQSRRPARRALAVVIAVLGALVPIGAGQLLTAVPALATPDQLTVNGVVTDIAGPSAQIQVFDSDSPATVVVHVTSDSDGTGVDVALPADVAPNYVGTVYFSTTASSPTTDTLKVADGDTVTFSYDNANPAGTLTRIVTWHQSTLALHVVGGGAVGLGKTVDVTLTDPVPNLDPSSADTATATIVSDIPVNLDLPETGVNTGVFHGQFVVGAASNESVSPPVVKSGYLQFSVPDGTSASLVDGQLLPCDAVGSQNCIQVFTVDGGAPPMALQLSVTQPGGGAIQVQVTRVGTANDRYDLTGALTSASDVHIALNVGGYDAIDTVVTGQMVSNSIALDATNGNVVTIDAHPHASSWSTGGCSVGACGDDAHPVTADADYGLMLIGAVDDMTNGPVGDATFDAFRADSRGSWIATNAQSFSSPAYDPSTGSFSFQLAAPHFTSNGSTVNTGFFTAFVPDALLFNEFGISDTSTVGTDLQTTQTDGGTTAVVAPTVAYDSTLHGVTVQMADGSFHYSSPQFAIGRPQQQNQGGGGGGGRGGSPTPSGPSAPPTLDQKVATSASPTGTATVTSTSTSGEKLVTTIKGAGSLILGWYEGKPAAADTTAPKATGSYFDVFVPATSSLAAADVKVCQKGDGHALAWYDSTAKAWKPVDDVAYDPVSGCLTVTLTPTSSPSLKDLTGTPFAVTGGPVAIGAACSGVTGSGFSDLGGDVHAVAADCIARYGVTAGTGGGHYSPGRTVTREQMASFLAALLAKAGLALPAAPKGSFTDVPAGDVHAKAISRLVALGVANGVTADRFDPAAPVSRAQMASFLVRAIELVTGTTLGSGTVGFTDVTGDAHAGDIGKLVGAGVTAGLTDTAYGPGVALHRDQMATFLARTLAVLVGAGKVTPQG